ncbi:hypothetical protein [Paenibacillus sp. CF384]|uniref:hypothetical protein n=1 Tax=Paenibacillus sp. CF384 TaxID=1884382 RepID=UPI00089444E6|nr:hypothetical protein [Paenibacillus sp. CF384]SDX74492.1 hypothetical protein SAMN05518855_102042 [Paenibacillus sp. CF384]
MKHKRLDHADTHEPSISDADVEHALDRLFEAVKDEEVPVAWMEDAEPDRAKQHSNEQPLTDEWTAREEPPAPIQIAPINEGTRLKKPRRLKKRWLSGATAAVLAGMLLFTSWGQDVMASMLGTFRVQHFETIEISQSDINGFRDALQAGTAGIQQLDLNRYGDIKQEGGGTARDVDAAEAATLAGAQKLKQLPGDGKSIITYMPEQQITFNLHPKEINKMIALLGGETTFPSSVEDSPIVIRMPNTFRMNQAAEDGSTAKQLLQMPAPSIEVSDDVDVEQIRQAVLDLPIIPDEMRAKLAGIGDWRHTLPVPSTSTDNVRTLKVDGNDAILAMTGDGRSLIWLQNEWVYQLSGSTKAYPTEEALINEARGIMK